MFGKISLLFAPYPFTPHPSPALSRAALDLLNYFARNREMTRAQWLLLGAVGLGLIIVMYFIFFCPTDCQ